VQEELLEFDEDGNLINVITGATTESKDLMSNVGFF